MIITLKNTILGFYSFIKDLFINRRLIYDLTKRDCKVRYLGNYLGILWAFIQPAFTILIMWFVFQLGFKSQPINNFPFILWLSSGMIPWTYLSDSINSGASSILENSFLVKKVVFRVSVLPIVKLMSALFIHSFFIVILMLMFIIYGYTPDLYWFETIYFLFASLILLTGITWITSSVIVFFRDFGNFIALILQFLFWGTPIFWLASSLPIKYHLLLKINPFYYIIDGYRDAFMYKTGFWNHPLLMAGFWIETIIIFIIGALIFKRLRPHFADVI